MAKKDNSIEEILKKLKSIDRRLNSIENFVKGEKEDVVKIVYPKREKIEAMRKTGEQRLVTSKVSKKTVKKGELPLSAEKQERIWINILHKVGIFALAIGVGLFIKYSLPYIGLWGRIAIGSFIGIGLLYLGEKLMKNYGAYALGISSCGIVILYFSFYAASAFYGLISPVAAFLLILLVTVTGVLLSLRYNTSVIAFIALTGAFLTPYVFRGGKITPTALVILFAYIALINGWILAVTRLKRWKWLNILAFVLTAMILLSTIKFAAKDGYPWVFLTFSTIFFALFFYIPRRENAESLVVLFLNPFLYYSVLWFITYKTNPYLAGTLALGLSVFFYYNGTTAERKKSFELAWSYTTLAIFFLTIAIPVFLKTQWSTLAWAVEGTVILSLGRKEKVFRILPLALLGIAVFKMFFIDYFLLEPISFLLNSAITIFSVFLCAKFLSTDRKVSGKQMAAALVAIGMFLVFWWTLTGTDKFFEKFDNLIEMKSLVISILWGIYSLVLFVTGIAKENPPAKTAGFIMASLTIMKVFFFDLSYLEAAYRILSLVILGVILLTISFIYQKKVVKSHGTK